MSKKVVRALDLGWGYSKFTIQNGEDGVTYGSIPSLAPRHTGIDLSGSLLGRRDTVVVKVQGTPYEVGPDSIDLDPNDDILIVYHDTAAVTTAAWAY